MASSHVLILSNISILAGKMLTPLSISNFILPHSPSHVHTQKKNPKSLPTVRLNGQIHRESFTKLSLEQFIKFFVRILCDSGDIFQNVPNHSFI